MSLEICWLGHASVRITSGDTVVYIDPWKVSGSQPVANLILVTHDHYDHFSKDDIEALSNDDTVVISPVDSPLVTENISPGEAIQVEDVLVEAVAAYNMGAEFHPKANGWVGFVVNIDGRRIYHSGDTDLVPEMTALNVDLALLPVGGTYTMDAESAADAVTEIGTVEVIPIHYGDIVGSVENARDLAERTSAQVHILNPGESYTMD